MIPPHELKNKEFTRVMRGYSMPEVDEYISFVMEKYTELYRENDALEQKLAAALSSLESKRAEEESVRTALINAQKTGKKIVSDANERADKIMRSTRSDCTRVLAEFRDKVAAERKTLTEMKTAVAALKQELFEKYQTHIAYIESLTVNVQAESDAMVAIDSEAYAQKLSDGIADLIREDFDFDVNTADSAVDSEKANAATQIFDVPKAQTSDASTATDATEDEKAKDGKTDVASEQEDGDAFLEALAEEIGNDLLVSDEEFDKVYGKQ